MSGLVVGAVFSSGLYEGADLMVLVKLADYCDDAGTCYPGLETLARMTGLTRRSVQRVLRRLEADGRDKAGGIAGTISTRLNGGRGHANKYEVNLTRLEAAKLGWYRSPDQPARFKSFDAMVADPVFGPVLCRRLHGRVAAIKGDSGDTIKGDSRDTIKGDSGDTRGDSGDANRDSRAAQRATGESPESIIESVKDSIAPERASDKGARRTGALDDWLAVRGEIKAAIGREDFASYFAMIRFAGFGLLTAPEPYHVDKVAALAGRMLAAAGFVKITSEAGGREIDL